MDTKHHATTKKKKKINEEIKEEISKLLKTNGNGNATLYHLWNAAKVILRWNFLAV